MKNEKLLTVLGVCILLTFIIWLFFTLFDFEKKPTINTLKVTDEEVEVLYNSFVVDKNLSRYTIYSGFKTQYDDLSYDYVASLAYYNLEDKLDQNLTMEELEAAGIAIYTREVKPIGKIDLDTFNKQIKKMFGNTVVIENTSFKITNRLNGCLSEDHNMIYIYEENVSENTYYVSRERESYATRDNGNTLVIYDYFIKCMQPSGDCYNDDRMTNFNRNVEMAAGKLTKEDKRNQAKYMHIFKWDEDHFYWVSSEIMSIVFENVSKK